MVRAERGANKGPGPSPERVSQLIQEAREVAEQSGCPVVVTASGENGTASIPIGKTPEFAKFPPDQKHVIFAPEGTQTILNGEKQGKRGKSKREIDEAVAARNARRAQNMSMFSGRMGKTVYENGRPVNKKGKNGRNGNH